MTHPMPNTSSMGSSGCSQVDRFSKHFEKCRNREGHMKASVFLPRDEDDALRMALSFNIVGQRKQRTPWKTWRRQVEEDITGIGLRKEDALDGVRWRNVIQLIHGRN